VTVCCTTVAVDNADACAKGADMAAVVSALRGNWDGGEVGRIKESCVFDADWIRTRYDGN
jgi:hypothetical protein